MIPMECKNMESKDLMLPVPKRSFLPSWHELRGVLNSGSDKIWGRRVSRLGEYFDRASWILNDWTTMVCLHAPNTSHRTVIPHSGWKWIPSVAALAGSGGSFCQNKKKNCFSLACQINDRSLEFLSDNRTFLEFHQENAPSKNHFLLLTILGYQENQKSHTDKEFKYNIELNIVFTVVIYPGFWSKRFIWSPAVMSCYLCSPAIVE